MGDSLCDVAIALKAVSECVSCQIITVDNLRLHMIEGKMCGVERNDQFLRTVVA